MIASPLLSSYLSRVRPSPATDTVSEYDSVLSFSVSESKEGQEEVGLALQECSCPWLASLAALRSETDCSHENELICDDTCPRGAVGVACFARDPEWLPSASAPLLPPSTELVTAVTEATESFVSLMTVYNNLLRRVHESEAVKRGFALSGRLPPVGRMERSAYNAGTLPLTSLACLPARQALRDAAAAATSALDAAGTVCAALARNVVTTSRDVVSCGITGTGSGGSVLTSGGGRVASGIAAVSACGAVVNTSSGDVTESVDLPSAEDSMNGDEAIACGTGISKRAISGDVICTFDSWLPVRAPSLCFVKLLPPPLQCATLPDVRSVADDADTVSVLLLKLASAEGAVCRAWHDFFKHSLREALDCLCVHTCTAWTKSHDTQLESILSDAMSWSSAAVVSLTRCLTQVSPVLNEQRASLQAQLDVATVPSDPVVGLPSRAPRIVPPGIGLSLQSLHQLYSKAAVDVFACLQALAAAEEGTVDASDVQATILEAQRRAREDEAALASVWSALSAQVDRWSGKDGRPLLASSVAPAAVVIDVAREGDEETEDAAAAADRPRTPPQSDTFVFTGYSGPAVVIDGPPESTRGAYSLEPSGDVLAELQRAMRARLSAEIEVPVISCGSSDDDEVEEDEEAGSNGLLSELRSVLQHRSSLFKT